MVGASVWNERSSRGGAACGDGATGAGGGGAIDGIGAIAGAGAIATAADPQLAGATAWAPPPQEGAAGFATFDPQLEPEDADCENVTGRAEIARGFANGMTLLAGTGMCAGAADIFGPGADTADICGAGEREPVGAGGALRGFGAGGVDGETTGLTDGEPGRDSFGSLGARRASTDVTSPISWGRGIRGTGATLGRDFRCCMKCRCTVQDANQRERRAAS